jgi:putative membrane protein
MEGWRIAHRWWRLGRTLRTCGDGGRRSAPAIRALARCRATALGLLAAFWAAAASAQPVGPGGGWGDRPWMMMHGGWGWGCGLAWLVALAVLAALAVILLRRRDPGAASGPAGGAVEALDLRYARGEIERDEYLRRRADILGRG